MDRSKVGLCGVQCRTLWPAAVGTSRWGRGLICLAVRRRSARIRRRGARSSGVRPWLSRASPPSAGGEQDFEQLHVLAPPRSGRNVQRSCAVAVAGVNVGALLDKKRRRVYAAFTGGDHEWRLAVGGGRVFGRGEIVDVGRCRRGDLVDVRTAREQALHDGAPAKRCGQMQRGCAERTASGQLCAAAYQSGNRRAGIGVVAVRRRHVQGCPGSAPDRLELPDEEADARQGAVWIVAGVEQRLHRVQPPG